MSFFDGCLLKKKIKKKKKKTISDYCRWSGHIYV
ncbi:unnamed protein product [Prunus brigantina]